MEPSSVPCGNTLLWREMYSVCLDRSSYLFLSNTVCLCNVAFFPLNIFLAEWMEASVSYIPPWECIHWKPEARQVSPVTDTLSNHCSLPPLTNLCSLIVHIHPKKGLFPASYLLSPGCRTTVHYSCWFQHFTSQFILLYVPLVLTLTTYPEP